MALQVTRCGIHGFHEVLGIDADKIRVFWVLESDDADAQQTIFRVEISTSQDFSAGSVWDSDKVEGNQQRNVLCSPQGGFQSATFHYWRVTVWDQSGNATESAVNEFFTAYPRSSGLLPPYSMNQTYVSDHYGLLLLTIDLDHRCLTQASYSAHGSRMSQTGGKAYGLVTMGTSLSTSEKLSTYPKSQHFAIIIDGLGEANGDYRTSGTLDLHFDHGRHVLTKIKADSARRNLVA